MEAVFGQEWKQKQLDLGRYFAKHFASRMVSDGLAVPPGLLEFLNGDDHAKNVRFCFTKDEALWLLRQHGVSQGGAVNGLWLRPTFAWLSPDKRELRGYTTQTYLGYVGVDFAWFPEEERLDSFFPHECPILNTVEATDDMRQLLNELGSDGKDTVREP